jgi:hypothetical protein
MRRPGELKVYGVTIWKHTADSLGVSFSTNNPLAFYEWAIETLNDFEIEHLEDHVAKMGKWNRMLAENPDAIEFKLRMRVTDQIDTAIFKMRWC